MEDFRGCSVAEAFAWSVVDLFDGVGKLLRADGVDFGSFGDVLAQETVGVLVAAALPGGVGVGEIDPDAGLLLDAVEGSEFLAVARREEALF